MLFLCHPNATTLQLFQQITLVKRCSHCQMHTQKNPLCIVEHNHHYYCHHLNNNNNYYYSHSSTNELLLLLLLSVVSI